MQLSRHLSQHMMILQYTTVIWTLSASICDACLVLCDCNGGCEILFKFVGISKWPRYTYLSMLVPLN